MEVSTFSDLLREEEIGRYFEALDDKAEWTSSSRVVIGGKGFTTSMHKPLLGLLDPILSRLHPSLYALLLPHNLREFKEWELTKTDIVTKYIEHSKERKTERLDLSEMRNQAMYSDYTTGDPFIVDDQCGEVLEVHHVAWTKKLTSEQKKYIASQPIPYGKRVFEPKRAETCWVDQVRQGGTMEEIKTFNLHTAPPYRRLKAKTPASLDEVDKELKPFLLNLCNDSEETLHVLLSWMKHCVVHKANTILVLIGKGATGKTTFARFCQFLVGDEYAGNAQASFFKTRFTSQLTEKRVILADEQGCSSQSEMDAAKKYVEDRVASERKGKDAESKDCHASLIITNNNYNCMAFRPTERKFTVPDVADLPLSNVFPSNAAYDRFVNRMKKDRKLIFFYNFLAAYETDLDRVTGFKGDTFWKMVENGEGLSDYEKCILACLKELEESEEESMDLGGFRRRVTMKLQAGGGKRRCQQSHIVQLLSAYEEAGRPIAEILEEGEYPAEIVLLKGASSSTLLEAEEEEDFLP